MVTRSKGIKIDFNILWHARLLSFGTFMLFQSILQLRRRNNASILLFEGSLNELSLNFVQISSIETKGLTDDKTNEAYSTVKDVQNKVK